MTSNNPEQPQSHANGWIQPGCWSPERYRWMSQELQRNLPPEFISTKPGAGGVRVHYLSADKSTSIANHVFGFGGWSSQIISHVWDQIEEINGKWYVSGATTIRVTLKDGTSHEDVGQGTMENAKSKAAAFEKARKEAKTDGLKRTLRNFGNVLGNCLYNKDYLSRVAKMPKKAVEFDPEQLYKGPTLAPQRRGTAAPSEEERAGMPTMQRANTNASKDTIDDEFGENLFDGVEIPDEENQNEDAPMPDAQSAETAQQHPPQARPQPKSGPIRSSRSMSEMNIKQPPDSPAANQPNPARPQQQPSTTMAAPPPPNETPKDPSNNPIPNQPHDPPIGFFTGSAAALLLEQEKGNLSRDTPLPRFKPELQPSTIRRSEGFDHAKSGPILRSAVDGAAPSASPKGGDARPQMIARNSSNFIDPASDAARRIGMPGAQSPRTNRTAYKPPAPAAGVKRDFSAVAAGGASPVTRNGVNGTAAGSAVRPALADVSNTSNQGGNSAPVTKVETRAGEEAKRLRVTS